MGHSPFRRESVCVRGRLLGRNVPTALWLETLVDTGLVVPSTTVDPRRRGPSRGVWDTGGRGPLDVVTSPPPGRPVAHVSCAAYAVSVAEVHTGRRTRSYTQVPTYPLDPTSAPVPLLRRGPEWTTPVHPSSGGLRLVSPGVLRPGPADGEPDGGRAEVDVIGPGPRDGREDVPFLSCRQW